MAVGHLRHYLLSGLIITILRHIRWRSLPLREGLPSVVAAAGLQPLVAAGWQLLGVAVGLCRGSGHGGGATDGGRWPRPSG